MKSEIGQTILARAMKNARQQLPADWLHMIAVKSKQARGNAYAGNSVNEADHLAAEVWNHFLSTYGGEAAANLSDDQIKDLAKTYAREAMDLEIGELLDSGETVEARRLAKFCAARGVTPPDEALPLAGRGARVRCLYWWRRALRKVVARKAEAGMQTLGFVSAPNHQPYASNYAVTRRIAQNRRNKAALEYVTLENDAGYRATLAQLSATSTSNKAIRRGELMTRIRGCEEIADECGHPGLFGTLTLPSRFHCTLRNGAANPKHNGATPRDGQKWLNKMWQKGRAKAARQGVKVYGFRVAEPHHDGCPHWHVLVWAQSAADLAIWQGIMRDYWLSDAGEEPGAQDYRTNFKPMEAGGAAGYIAKYISKNIDDHGIESHLDDYADSPIGLDLIGDLEIKPCQRVEAWASLWNIRQFQALGQPPVTVWRELRRITEATAKKAGVGGMVWKAWTAAQKLSTSDASWSKYCKAQGGMGCGRAARIKMRHDQREMTGLYGTQTRAMPIGVALNCKGSLTVWSERRLWRAVAVVAPVCELKQAKRAARTGVNNCTPTDPIQAGEWIHATDKSGSWTVGIPKNEDWHKANSADDARWG